jgi:preprotein translocase subunit SecD
VRTLITLVVLIVALFAALFGGTKWSDATWTPKLALDLEGGTQLILAPKTEDNASVSRETIQQAIEVIRQRVDSSGVAEAEITSQGGSNIVVALPGKPSEATLDLVRTSAQMEFRPVLTYADPTPTATDGATTDPSADPSATGAPDADATISPDGVATSEPTDGATAENSSASSDAVFSNAVSTGDDAVVRDAAATDDPTAEPSPSASAGADGSATGPESPSDINYYVTEDVLQRFNELDCTDPKNLTGGDTADPDTALVTCDPTGTIKYILGPVEITGDHISNATSGIGVNSQGVSTGQWVVNLSFDGTGTDEFNTVTTRLQGLQSPQNQFAIVLDGLVISAPSLSPGTIIADGKAEISGSFNRESATTLANQLKFGALPISFDVQSEEQISATLGSEQLEKGLIAGLIGLLLVVIYSLFQYRALGFVTVLSLVIAAVLTYGVITLLSWTQGYRLSLPGVAGLIVAIGITADSFIVYFERIRDELREGRTLVAAVDRGWERARRTILASDAVNFLAAIVLYFLAVGSVRGFAFTLGLTTLLDLLIVFVFTHPVMLLIAKTKFFGSGHPLSGLDPRRLGATGGTRYVGRGRVATGRRDADPEDGGLSTENPLVATTVPGGTIAERRAAARAAAQGTAPHDAASRDTAPTDTPTDGSTPAERTEGND